MDVVAPRARYALIPLALVPLAVIRASLLAESDTFWQIRVGLDILRRHRVPVADPYSWTARGQPWHPNSWLFDVGLALAYRAGGLALVALAAAAFIPLTAWAITMLARRLGAQPGVTLLVTLVGLTPLVVWLSARPQIVDYPSAVLIVLLADIAMTSARLRARWLAVAAVVSLQVVWVNLHLAAVVGVALTAAVVAVHFVVRPTARQALWALGALLAAVVGTITNLFGMGVFTIGLRVQQSSTVVKEWGSLTLSDHASQGLLAIAVVAVVVAWRLRWYPLAVPIAGLAAAGVFTIRLLPFAAVLGLPVLAAAGARTPKVTAYIQSRRALLVFALCGILLAESAVAIARSTQVGRSTYPLAALATLPSGCKLFNGYQLGGPVILLRPDIPVSQDSRSDLYGTAALASARDVEARSAGRAELDELGITCVLIEPASQLARDLTGDPGWLRLGGNDYGTVFVRTTPAPVT